MKTVTDVNQNRFLQNKCSCGLNPIPLSAVRLTPMATRLPSKPPLLRNSRRKLRDVTNNNAIVEVSSIAAGIESKARLESVIGCTVKSRCSMDVDCNTGIVAYPAGPTVVLQNPVENSQAHVIGKTKNDITCLSLSPCGKYLATGESGHDPCLRIWELYNADGQFAASQVACIEYHQEKIACVRFVGGGMRVISVGNEHDGLIAIWDWRTSRRIANSKFVLRVLAMDETMQGAYVTVGVRHVKFWYVSGAFDSEKTLMLQGRSAILADRRNDTFVDVCCAPNNKTFAIGLAKVLLEFNDRQLIGTYDLNGETPFTLVLGDDELLIGFAKGTLQSFDMKTTKLKAIHCKPLSSHCTVTKEISTDEICSTLSPNGCRPPDVRALCYNKKSRILTAKFSDQSLYSWQKSVDGDATSMLSSEHFHSASIFAVEVYGCTSSFLPADTFITGAADATIRIWNFSQRAKNFQQPSTSFTAQKNAYCEELKVIDVSNSRDLFVDPPNSMAAELSEISFTFGARSLRISPDGQHLACGRTDGNIHIYDLTLPELPMLATHEAHEAEVMCLEYSNPLTCARYLLASGGRDRFIHIYDPLNGYLPLASVDDLSSTVHSIVFASFANELILLSCASDKTIVARKMTVSEPSSVRFERVNQITAQFGLNSMVMGANGVVVACQDKQLRTFSLQGKLVKEIKVAASRDGQLTKLRVHPAGTFAAVVCTDRKVYIVNLSTGECGAVLSGMSGVITDVAFSSDCRRLIVVSSNGCIFLWRLSDYLVKKMNRKRKWMRISPEHRGGMLNEMDERLQTPESSLGSGNDAISREVTEPSTVDEVEVLESESESVNSWELANRGDSDRVSKKRDGITLNVTDISAKHKCAEMGVVQGTGSNLLAHSEAASIQHPADEIAKGITECLSQWDTAVNAVIQLRNLLQTSKNLCVGERERMMDTLKFGISDGRRRLSIFDDH